MSDPKLIEPLLANHIMGEPISDHNGVRCCPAMEKDSDQKYIVKILSIPASTKQMDALLLSGACKSRDDAQCYFKELADEAVSEAELLQKLSRLEGFQSYDSWQIEPMEDGIGYDVYLLAPYSQTLERHLRRNALTHLAAVNLGLDLCAALSVCRRNGYLYVDLKPENIFLSDTHGYLIGDLGFIRLSSLKYASLPEKYHSAYTAPEIEDAYSALNSTLDIYAAGLILYQVYNNGVLPQPGQTVLPPEYADYEMAEIILKACATDPQKRWQDPQEMGQALVSYMQRNAVNDDPIIPPIIPEEPETEEFSQVESTAEETDACECVLEEISEEEIVLDDAVEEQADAAAPEEACGADIAAEVSADENVLTEASVEEENENTDESAEGSESTPPIAESIPTDPEEEELEQFVIEGFLFDDPAEDLDVSDLPDTALSDEVSQMLAQADELIAHKAPDPVVAPAPIEIPIPDPIVEEPEEVSEEIPEEISQSAPVTEELEEELEEESDEETDDEPNIPVTAPKRHRKLGWLIAVLILILALSAAGIGAKYYYENEYLQNVQSVTVTGAEDWLNVSISTDIDNSLLTVTCTDTYGNKLTQPVENNQASFSSLPSGTAYKIAVTISGRHELTGNTTATYTTPTQTNIVGFTGITGDSDGSVILNFSVQGPDASGWLVKYCTDGEAELTSACSGHTAIITGLTAGKTYTFRLVPKEDLYVVGGDTLEFTASNVICAQDLAIQGFENGALIAAWTVPEGAVVESWTVRCFNNAGIDLTFTVTEPMIAIAGLDISQGYTLDVMASGMTVSKWTSISAGSLSFKDILLDDSVPGQMTVTWNYEGTAPEEGWNLVYTVDGSAPITVNCQKNSCTLEDLVPGGHYAFDLQIPTGTSVFGTTSGTFDVPESEMFQGYGITAEHMLFQLCRAPQIDDWTWQDVADEDFTSDFLAGDSAAFIIQLTQEYQTSTDLICATFIIRDQNGSILNITHSEQTWTSMWYQGYCELNLPALPTAAGSYTVEIYLNGDYITAEPIPFTVT